MNSDQIALFGDIERADWVAKYDCGLGPIGTVILGYRCPACGDVEPNAFLLENNHWVSVDRPLELRWRQECIAMQLRAHHAEYERQQAGKVGAS